jgi:hypothetical protein
VGEGLAPPPLFCETLSEQWRKVLTNGGQMYIMATTNESPQTFEEE